MAVAIGSLFFLGFSALLVATALWSSTPVSVAALVIAVVVVAVLAMALEAWAIAAEGRHDP